MMIFFPFRYAIAMAKLAARLIKWFKLGSGSTVPGRVALAIRPTLLSEWFADQCPKNVIAITGTNGKTTTAGLLAAMLEAHGLTVVHNTLGANMRNGIASALVMATGKMGKLKNIDAMVLEVDEASLRHVAKELPIRDVVVTNLFRDQLDRYGELDTTAQFIAEGVAECDPEGARYCNIQDDTIRGMMTTLAAQQPKSRFMGLAMGDNGQADIHPDDIPAPEKPLPTLLQTVPCRFEQPAWERPIRPLKLNGQTVPVAQLYVTNSEPDRTLGRLSHPSLVQPSNITIPLAGKFNGCNALAALAVALDWGVPLQTALAAMDNYAGVFGRSETLTVQGKTVKVFLIKNPVGATEVFRTVAADPTAHVLLGLNDNDADGRDVSWIWDAAFEWLVDIPAFTCTGKRAADLAVRLKYAGVGADSIAVVEDVEGGLTSALVSMPPDGTLYVLPSYTALLRLQQVWAK